MLNAPGYFRTAPSGLQQGQPQSTACYIKVTPRGSRPTGRKPGQRARSYLDYTPQARLAIGRAATTRWRGPGERTLSTPASASMGGDEFGRRETDCCPHGRSRQLSAGRNGPDADAVTPRMAVAPARAAASLDQAKSRLTSHSYSAARRHVF